MESALLEAFKQRVSAARGSRVWWYLVGNWSRWPWNSFPAFMIPEKSIFSGVDDRRSLFQPQFHNRASLVEVGASPCRPGRLTSLSPVS